jgi:carbamate kinase
VTTVIALGGNALMRPGERGTAAEQRANLRETCEALRPLLGDGHLAVTHGNGPQVGNELVRQERAADEVPPLPLYLAVAQTQAEIGALIESELTAVAGRPVACLLTHVRVDEADPAFELPTKPIGPFYAEDQARQLESERGWVVAHDAGRGWRRVVPSPKPLEIVELEAVRTLLATGTIAVACGGGGIPVSSRNGRLSGIDAVIDKDRASSLLAVALGAERLVILTDVDAVYRGWGTAEQEALRELDAGAVAALLPELAAGSMRPKLEASLAFARATGHDALITSASSLAEALAGRAGTRIRPSRTAERD